jgi:hypothetical protein
VPDNILTFISVLQKIGRLNAVAATSAALAAFLKHPLVICQFEPEISSRGRFA